MFLSGKSFLIFFVVSTALLTPKQKPEWRAISIFFVLLLLIENSPFQIKVTLKLMC